MIGKRIEVVRYEPTDPRLGRHVEHDNRSKKFAFMARQRRPKRITTHWPSAARVLDQGDLGACTGFTMAQWLNTDFARSANRKHGAFFDENDAIHIYSKATRLDSFPGVYEPEDSGSSGNAACKAARSLGYIEGYSWLFSFGSLQAAIELSPLMVGTLWTNNMFEPTGGLVKIGSLKNSNIAGGHEYLMTGIDWESEVFEFRNSWGEWEGSKPGGYFAISFRDFVQLLAADGDVSVPKLPEVQDGATSQENSGQGQG